jgi:hypothetical protein
MQYLSLPDLIRNICDKQDACIEKGKVRTNRVMQSFTFHIRIDSGAIRSHNTIKCDCLVLLKCNKGCRPILFFIEVKTSGSSESEAISQIEMTIEHFKTAVATFDWKGFNEKFILNSLPTKLSNRKLKLLFTIFVDIKGFKYEIYPTIYTARKVHAAKRLAISAPKARVTIAKGHKVPALYKQYGEDLFSHLN